MSKNKNNKKKNAPRKGNPANRKPWASNPIFTGELARILQEQVSDGDIPEGELTLHFTLSPSPHPDFVNIQVDGVTTQNLGVLCHFKALLQQWDVDELVVALAHCATVEAPHQFVEGHGTVTVPYSALLKLLVEVLPLVQGMGAFCIQTSQVVTNTVITADGLASHLQKTGNRLGEAPEPGRFSVIDMTALAVRSFRL